MSYGDIVEAREKRDLKVASRAGRGGRKSKRGRDESQPPQRKRPLMNELNMAEREIETSGLAGFCTVFRA